MTKKGKLHSKGHMTSSANMSQYPKQLSIGMWVGKLEKSLCKSLKKLQFSRLFWKY